MRRFPSLLVNLTLAVLAVGAAIWAVTLVRGSGTFTSSTKTAAARTVSVGQGTVTSTVSADGTLNAATTASASFATSGTVTAVYVKVGDEVKSGALLAKVDPAAAQRSLDLARANLTAAYDALSRAENASQDTTTAGNELAQAKIALADAQAGVTGTRLTAPMAGTVTAVNGTIGSTSSASSGSGSASSGSASSGSAAGGSGASATGSSSTGFVELANLGELQVSADFGEADATQLKIGQSATITWSALTGATATGKILAIDPSGTTSSNVVTYGVTTSITKLPAGAKAGQSVSVEVTTGTAANVTYVNSAAVTLSGTTYSVTVQKDDGTTEKRTVKVGVLGDDTDQIVSGLTVGEKVVVPTTSTSTSTSGNSGPGGSGLGGGTGGGPGGNGGPP